MRSRHWRFRCILVVGAACVGLPALSTPALAHDDHRRSGLTYTTHSTHRLSRHRSGYLYRPARHERRRGVRFANPYENRAAGYGAPHGGGHGGCAAPLPDARADFDARRDRLLHVATTIDVSYLYWGQSRYGEPAPVNNGPRKGWALLNEGNGVRALGRFTAKLMTAPGNPEALLGFSLAASQIGDTVEATRAMRAALMANPNIVESFQADDAIAAVIRTELARYTEDLQCRPDAAVMAAALHCLLDEHDAAQTVLAELSEQRADQPAVHALLRIAATSTHTAPDEAITTAREVETNTAPDVPAAAPELQTVALR